MHLCLSLNEKLDSDEISRAMVLHNVMSFKSMANHKEFKLNISNNFSCNSTGVFMYQCNQEKCQKQGVSYAKIALKLTLGNDRFNFHRALKSYLERKANSNSNSTKTRNKSSEDTELDTVDENSNKNLNVTHNYLLKHILLEHDELYIKGLVFTDVYSVVFLEEVEGYEEIKRKCNLWVERVQPGLTLNF